MYNYKNSDFFQCERNVHLKEQVEELEAGIATKIAILGIVLFQCQS